MIRSLEKGVRGVTNTLCYIGMILLAALMFLGALDVMGRYFLNKPIKGAYETSEILLAGIVFFGLAYALAVGGHVAVEGFVALFPSRTRAIAGIATSSLSLIIFILIGWQGAKLAIRSWEAHRLIDVLFVPIAPFQLLVPVGAFAVCLELLVAILHFIAAARKAP